VIRQHLDLDPVQAVEWHVYPLWVPLSLEIDMQTDWSDWKGGLLFALILLVVVVAWCLFVFGLNAGH
jgi:hypothetical protein